MVVWTAESTHPGPLVETVNRRRRLLGEIACSGCLSTSLQGRIFLRRVDPRGIGGPHRLHPLSRSNLDSLTGSTKLGSTQEGVRRTAWINSGCFALHQLSGICTTGSGSRKDQVVVGNAAQLPIILIIIKLGSALVSVRNSSKDLSSSQLSLTSLCFPQSRVVPVLPSARPCSVLVSPVFRGSLSGRFSLVLFAAYHG